MTNRVEEQRKQYPWLDDKEVQKKIHRKLSYEKDAFVIPKDPKLVPHSPRKRNPSAPKTVYLAGPMEGMSYDEAANWRDEATKKLKKWGVRTRNPMVRDFREVFANGGYVPGNLIIEPDKEDILQSDAVLVWYSDKSTGTAMEILWAYYWEVPVIVIAVKSPVSPWVDYHATAIYSTLDEAIMHITRLEI